MLEAIIQSWSDFITTATGGSETIAASITLSLTASMVYIAKGIPVRMYQWLRRVTVSEITADLDSSSNFGDSDYNTLERFITRNRGVYGSRNFMAERLFNINDLMVKWELKTGMGFHYFIYKGRLFWAIQEELESSGSEMIKRRITLSTFSFTGAALQNVLDTFNVKKVEDGLVVMYEATDPDSLRSFGFFKTPDLDDLLLARGVAKKFHEILDGFDAGKEECQRLFLPHKCTILLHGEPGNGKSTIIPSIASLTGRDVVRAGFDMFQKDSDLLAFLINQTDNIVVFEDIHSFQSTHRHDLDRENISKLTLSGLLNALNGMIQLQSNIIILTTNYIEDLDPALVRPGRIDHIIELPRIEPELLDAHIAKLYPEWETIPPASKALRGCDVGQLLEATRKGPEAYGKKLIEIEKALPPPPTTTHNETNVVRFDQSVA